jgi:hypothetical protein
MMRKKIRWLLLCIVLLCSSASVGQAENPYIIGGGNSSLSVNGFIGSSGGSVRFAIEAQKIEVRVEEVSKLDIISASKARLVRIAGTSTSTSTSTSTDIVVYKSTVKANPGNYSVTLAYKNDLSVVKTIPVIVKENSKPKPSEPQPNEEEALAQASPVLPKLGMNRETLLYLFGFLLIFSVILTLLNEWRKRWKK